MTLAVAFSTLAVGCSTPPEGGAVGAPAGAGAAAVWVVAPGQDLDAETEEFTALVNRLGCNSGVTGEVRPPGIHLADDHVAITFTVGPADPLGGDCQGTDQVPYEVTLPEPLGDRRLIDGQCASEASGTSFCEPDGVRHQP